VRGGLGQPTAGDAGNFDQELCSTHGLHEGVHSGAIQCDTSDWPFGAGASFAKIS
jgi:hypothetical protein